MFMFADPPQTPPPPPCGAGHLPACPPITPFDRHLSVAVILISLLIMLISVARYAARYAPAWVKAMREARRKAELLKSFSPSPGLVLPELRASASQPPRANKALTLSTVTIAVLMIAAAVLELILNWHTVVSDSERSLYWIETFGGCLLGCIVQLWAEKLKATNDEQGTHPAAQVFLALGCAVVTYFGLYQKFGTFPSKIPAIYFAFVNGYAWKSVLNVQPSKSEPETGV